MKSCLSAHVGVHACVRVAGSQEYTVCDGRPTSPLIPYKLFRTLRSESERLVRLFKFFIRTKEMEPCVNKPRIRVICIGMSTRTTYKCT